MQNQEIEELKKQVEDLKTKIKETSAQNFPVSTPAEKPINEEEKEEYRWESPVRVFVKWDRKKITTIFLFLSILCLFLIYLKEYILLITSILVTLVSAALVIVPPNKAVHIITNRGILSFEKLYLWEDLKDFWVAQKNGGIVVMYVLTKLAYPTRLFFVLPEKNIPKVTDIMSKHLKYHEITDTQNVINRISDGIYVKYNDLKTLTTSTTV